MQLYTSTHAKQPIIIGVLFGGRSIEREVSLNSGRTLCDHLDRARFTVLPIFQTQTGMLYILPERFLHRGKTTDFEYRLPHEALPLQWEDLPHRVDIIYIAMHGRYGEDGTLQGLLTVLNIPYFGSKIFASALGMDKSMQRLFLAAAQITTPPTTLITRQDIISLRQCAITERSSVCIEKTAHLVYPLIVKPSHEGSSLGITAVTHPDSLPEAILTAATITPGIIQPVLVETYIQGMEFSCIIITDRHTGEPIPLPPTEIIPDNTQILFDYEQKYMPGRATKYTPARCTPEDTARIQQTSIAAMKALGMERFARIDGFLKSDGSIVLIEANSFGGLSPASFTFLQAAEIGMGHTQLINHLVESECIAAGLIVPSTAPSSHEANMLSLPPDTIRVAVLLGGSSAEREISLDSGRNVVYKLSPHRYQVTPLFVDMHMRLFPLTPKLLVKNSTQEIITALQGITPMQWDSLPQQFDFVFIALHGGPGENGAVQGALEMLQLPYNGSGVLTSALCMDKHKTGIFLKQQGFDIPNNILIHRDTPQLIEQLPTLLDIHHIPMPAIVKPHDDGCSVLVHKAHTVSHCYEALQTIFSSGRHYALVESYITGMELTVGVIGNDTPYVLPPSYTVTSGDILSVEEKFLPGAGENQTPAPLPPHAITFVQNTIARVYQALGCSGYARIDCFYQTPEISPTGKERLVILECNSLPGLTPATCIFHQAAELGIAPMEFIDLIIFYGLEKHAPHTLHTIDIKIAEALKTPSETMRNLS